MPRLQLLSSKNEDCGDGQKQLTGRTKCRVSVQVHWRDASAGLVVHTGVAGGGRTGGAIKLHKLGYMVACLMTQFLFHLGIIRLLAKKR